MMPSAAWKAKGECVATASDAPSSRVNTRITGVTIGMGITRVVIAAAASNALVTTVVIAATASNALVIVVGLILAPLFLSTVSILRHPLAAPSLHPRRLCVSITGITAVC